MRRRTQAFKGSRRALVTVAAAESDVAPTPAARAPRAPQTPLASIEPNQMVEGKVVSLCTSFSRLACVTHSSGLTIIVFSSAGQHPGFRSFRRHWR